MTKNILVVDEQGNEYEATYPKRAKGLVKNGRARFVDENKICLACPPNHNLEDNIMEHKTILAEEAKHTEEAGAQAAQMSTDHEIDSKFDEAVALFKKNGKISTSILQRHLCIGYGRAAEIIRRMEQCGIIEPTDDTKPLAKDVAEQPKEAETETSAAPNNSKYTLDYILTQLETLRSQMDISVATNGIVAALNVLPSKGNDADNTDENKAQAIDSMRMMYIAQQTSIQKMLGFYEKMYDDLRPNNDQAKRTEMVMKVLSCEDEETRDAMLNTLRHIMELL